jgi:superoxide dismutase, Cu-Zn family
LGGDINIMKKHLQFALVVPVAVGIAASFVWACSEDDPKPNAGTSTSSSGSTGNTTSSSGSTGSSGSTSGSTSGTSGTSGTPVKARATIAQTTDSGVMGTVDFSELGDETTVTISITNGGAPGNHGMHIHANPSCENTDAGPGLGAGGHWNPLDAGHGYPTATPHHMGDLGNISIAANGTGAATLKSKEFKVSDGANSVVGHAVIYHAFNDDGTGTIGDAGARPGCGVIVKQ